MTCKNSENPWKGCRKSQGGCGAGMRLLEALDFDLAESLLAPTPAPRHDPIDALVRLSHP